MKQTLIQRRRPIFALIVYFILYTVIFNYLEATVQPKFIIHCLVDDWIPFWKWAVIPYFFWFAWIPTIVLTLLWKAPAEFWQLFWVMAGGCATALAIYALLPNGLNLRGPVAGNDLLAQAVRWLYRADTPTNVCPSLHVYQSVCVYLAICRSRLYAHRPRFRAASLAITVAICASTVLLDQHSVIDVACGLGLCLLLDGVVSVYLRRHAEGAVPTEGRGKNVVA